MMQFLPLLPVVAAFDETAETNQIKISQSSTNSFRFAGRRGDRLRPPGGQEQHHGPRPRPQPPPQGESTQTFFTYHYPEQ